MCCFITVLFLLGPRAALALWWLLDQAWFNRLYDTFVWPFLGFLFLPFTTLMYTLVATPSVGLTGWNWLWVGMAAVVDIAGHAGGGFGNRSRIPGFSGSPGIS